MLEKFVHRLETIEAFVSNPIHTTTLCLGSCFEFYVKKVWIKAYDSRIPSIDTAQKKKKREKKAEISKERGLEFNTGTSIPRD